MCLAVFAILLVAVLSRSRLVRAAFSGLILFWSNLSTFGRVAGVLAIAVFAVFGGAKTKAMRPELLQSSVPPVRHGGTVSFNDIVRGYRVDSVVTNGNFSYRMPSGAAIAGNWHKRGTYGEWMRLDLDGFAFPLGNDDGVYTAFSVFNDGKIRPNPRDGAHEICKTVPENVPGLSFRAKYGSFDDASRTWTCPVTNSAVSGGLSVYAYGDKIYNFLTLVLPPRQIAAERAVGLDFNVPAGTAGGAGMLLDLFVLPKTVSFSKLYLAEVPTETAGPSGYFTNPEFSAVWYHTRAMGAGEWMPVHRDNSWCHDEAMMGDSFPPQNVLEWEDGTIIWDIPVAWDLDCPSGTNFSNRIPVVYTQRFDFNESGTLRVSKHGFWAERDADNVKRASEGINIWTPYLPEEQEDE